jgi:predicted xylose isomerase-like sugar epimerase
MGDKLLITLGGEPVVDYSLKFKEQFGQQTWVVGYCNDVMAYIPSLRVLKEGGYEGGGAMIPYGQPALRWGDDVEDLISASVDRLATQVRAVRN